MIKKGAELLIESIFASISKALDKGNKVVWVGNTTLSPVFVLEPSNTIRVVVFQCQPCPPFLLIEYRNIFYREPQRFAVDTRGNVYRWIYLRDVLAIYGANTPEEEVKKFFRG